MQNLSEALSYIEENLTESGNFDRLAECIHYSHSHFRHLFTRETGQPIAAYIRAKRLERARAQILNTNRTILDIAVGNGFNSPQVFNRAFKRRYGVTPTQLRKRRSLLAYTPWNITKKRGTPMHYAPPPFTDEDRKYCIPAIKRMLALSEKARREGRLSLQNDNNLGFFLEQLIRLFVDGVDEETIRDMMSKLLQAQQYTNVELLERMIYLEGMKSLWSGENPSICEIRLSNFLGETFLTSGAYLFSYDYFKHFQREDG